MTWLDAAVLVFLLLAAIGGYAQGLIRGLVHLAALGASGILGAMAMLRFANQATTTAAIKWTVAGLATMTLLVALVAWALVRAVPRFVHRNQINRLLGIIPAVVIAVVVAALLLGIADQIAPTSNVQELIEHGLITAPLLLPAQLLQQYLVAHH